MNEHGYEKMAGSEVSPLSRMNPGLRAVLLALGRFLRLLGEEDSLDVG